MEKLSAALLLLMAGITLGGCGSSVSGSGSGNAVTASKGCTTGGCHEVIASEVTGNAIGAEWNASSHKTMNVAGCTTCHGHYHQNSCSNCHGGALLQNPQQNSLDANARCFDCHVSGPALMKGLDHQHIPELNPKYRLNSGFTYYSAVGYVTMRGTAYESKCIWCHNPHDNRVLPQHEDWAESGHGSTNSGPFASRNIDFKTRGSWPEWSQSFGDVCVRCHTASGYINLVSSGMKDVSPWGLKADGKPGEPISFTRQSIYCNVCHDNSKGKAYGYKLRQIPALGSTGGLRVHYNYSSATVTAGLATLARARISDTIDFPNIGISDRCLLCHSGRGTGNLIKKAGFVTDASGKPFNFRNNNRIGMHDFAGGATMFGRSGFEFYSSYRYEGSAGIQQLHDDIGAGYPGTGSRGPCVSCHMSTAKSHEYVPVTLGSTSLAVAPNTQSIFPSGRAFTVASIDTSICMACHSTGQVAASRFNGTVSALNTEKKGYHAALRAIYVWLNKKALASSSDWLKASTYSWTGAPAYVAGCTPTVGADIYFGSRNMGVSFNYDFLKNDPAGYVHNDLYVKRLIYDSLDWIDDCSMNGTADRAITDAGNSAYFGATLSSSGIYSTLGAEEITSALNYLFGVPNVYSRPEGN